jgi:DNA-directed RNA polymerase subunit RPC12/RpoP
MAVNYSQVIFDDSIADDYGRELLRNGIIEAKAGNKDAAHRYFDRATYMSSDHEVMAEAWFWMSQITDNPVEKRQALENCLSNNLGHARARRALAILDGQIKPDEIINPDALPAAPAHLSQADAQRFMCPKCGGRMNFAPDGQALVCEYCSRNQALHTQAGSAKQEDFIIAMATARGHDKPLAEQVFQCQGCGAQFILPADQLSAVCVYCGSPHVINLEKSKDLIAPDGIIPFAFDQKHVVQLLIRWVEGNQIKPEKQVEPPRGLYLPLWTFDLGGVIDYTGEMVDIEDAGFHMGLGQGQPKVIHVNDSYPLLIHDIPIPASRKLSAPFVRLIRTFDLKAIQPYDARYLADWPAELYDIPMADASLDARSQTLASIKRDLPMKAGLVKLISASSANMTVDSFRLNLFPVWMTEIWLENRSHLVLISGQNGVVQSDIIMKSDKPGVIAWLGDLLKD